MSGPKTDVFVQTARNYLCLYTPLPARIIACYCHVSTDDQSIKPVDRVPHSPRGRSPPLIVVVEELLEPREVRCPFVELLAEGVEALRSPDRNASPRTIRWVVSFIPSGSVSISYLFILSCYSHDTSNLTSTSMPSWQEASCSSTPVRPPLPHYQQGRYSGGSKPTQQHAPYRRE